MGPDSRLALVVSGPAHPLQPDFMTKKTTHNGVVFFVNVVLLISFDDALHRNQASPKPAMSVYSVLEQ